MGEWITTATDPDRYVPAITFDAFLDTLQRVSGMYAQYESFYIVSRHLPDDDMCYRITTDKPLDQGPPYFLYVIPPVHEEEFKEAFPWMPPYLDRPDYPVKLTLE